MTRFTKFMTAAGLTLFVLAAAACGGSSHLTTASRSSAHNPRPAANSAPAPQDANSTRGFHYYNSTGYDLKFTNSIQTGGGQCGGDVLDGGGPSIGSVIHSGSSMDFEMIYHFAATTWCTVYFDVLNGTTKVAQFGVNFGINGGYSPYAQTDTNGTTTGWTVNVQLEDDVNLNYTKIELLPYLQPLPPVSPTTWMHDLAPEIQNRELSQIVIPGSHDSTTYSLGAYWDKLSFATTQSEDLTGQLNSGMRDFDIRVGYHNGNYYARHGSQFSNLTLSSIFSDIAAWATQPNRGQEIILLNLGIDGGVPTADCQSFAKTLDGSTSAGALVTPDEMSRAVGTTDPGKVTLADLWSLPNPTGAARVIMDNTQCLNAAVPGAGDWYPNPPFGSGASTSYYADQCSDNGEPGDRAQYWGITKRVIGALQYRYVDGDGSEPIPYGPVMHGGLYTIFLQGTPELDCLVTPYGLLVHEQRVLAAVYQQWQNSWAIRTNLNIISGDFVERTDLWKDAICMNTWRRAGC